MLRRKRTYIYLIFLFRALFANLIPVFLVNIKSKIQKYYRVAAINLMLIAVTLHIIGFFRGTSFFLDELNLARNIAELSYLDLLFPLKYEQYAPPLFLQLVKGSADIFGYTECGLRLIPLFASLISMVLFYLLLKRVFKNWQLLYPLILLIFNFYCYQQGMALKQYSLDILLTILWVSLAIQIPNLKGKRLIYFAFLGILSVWLSMPVVFILTGVGFYFLYNKWKTNETHFESKSNSYLRFIPLLLMIGSWLISFGILFWINLRHGIQTSGLQEYHTTYFLEIPTSFANIQQSWELIIGIFRAIVGKTAIAIGWAVLCFILGVLQIWKKDKTLLILLLLPVLTCFFASILHYYSLIIRLTLFMFPLLIMIMGFGVVFLFEKINFFNKVQKSIALIVVSFFMVFSVIHRNALPYFWTEYVRGNPRSILNEISQTNEQNLPFYTTNFGVPAYDFYTKYYETPIVINSKTVVYGGWNDDLIVLAKEWKEQGIERVWIFDTHTFGEDKVELEKDIKQIGNVEIHFKETYADAYLVKLK